MFLNYANLQKAMMANVALKDAGISTDFRPDQPVPGKNELIQRIGIDDDDVNIVKVLLRGRKLYPDSMSKE